MKSRAPNHRLASTILLALWALLVLSVVVISWAKMIDGSMTLAAHANRKLDARALAESGYQIACNPLIGPTSPHLNSGTEEDGYQVVLAGEGSRLNLNWLLSDPENQARLDLLDRFLERKGVKFQQRAELIDCLIDFVDEDDLKRLNGVEDEGDYKPLNRAFKSLDEVALVRGSEEITANPDWKDWFTIYSTGPIDLRWADEEVLGSIPGIGDLKAQAMLRIRRGGDKRDNTQDDFVFRKIEDATRLLGLDGEQLEAISDLLTITDSTVRIESTGSCAGTTSRIEAVVRRNEGRPQVLRWREF